MNRLSIILSIIKNRLRINLIRSSHRNRLSILELLIDIMNPETDIKKCFVHTMKKFGISDSFYNFGGYKEGASCVIRQNNKWCVFDAERAEKYNIKEFENMEEACLEVIRRFTYSDDEYILLTKEFYKEYSMALEMNQKLLDRIFTYAMKHMSLESVFNNTSIGNEEACIMSIEEKFKALIEKRKDLIRIVNNQKNGM